MASISKIKTRSLLSKALPEFVRMYDTLPDFITKLTPQLIEVILNEAFGKEDGGSVGSVYAAIHDMLLASPGTTDNIVRKSNPFYLSFDIGFLSKRQVILLSIGTPHGYKHTYTKVVITIEDDFTPSVSISAYKVTQ